MLKQTDMQNHKCNQLGKDKLEDTDSKQLDKGHIETLSIQCTMATINNKQLEDIKRQKDTDSNLFKQLDDIDNKIMVSKHQSIIFSWTSCLNVRTASSWRTRTTTLCGAYGNAINTMYN